MDECSRDQRNASAVGENVNEQIREALTRLDVREGETPAIAMISGGGDSTAMLLLLAQILGTQHLSALHLNYGLRGDESDADEAFCRELCDRIGVELTVVSAGAREPGNLQDWARNLRYREAERMAEQLGPEAVIAVAHNADDQAETILYRLFASPGRRALVGIPERRGRIVRPLLGVRRAELRGWLRDAGETWREDASNSDPQFARVRARALLEEAETLHPAAVANLLQTAEDLRQEGAELEDVVVGLTAQLTTEEGELNLEGLGELPPALGGAVLRCYVEQRRPVPVPKAARVLGEALRLGRGGERRELQVEGARLSIQKGLARVLD